MNELKPEDVMRALECCIEAEGAPDCYKLNCPARLGNGLCYYEIDCEFNSEEEALKKMLVDALALLREKDAEIANYILQIAEMQKQIATQDSELTALMKCKHIEADKDAEIERLTAQIEHCDACDRIGLTHSEHKACIKQARAEAVTEFAERLKTRYIKLPHYCDATKGVLAIVNESIDRIAKEMKEVEQ